jgi:hypothetical protein
MHARYGEPKLHTAAAAASAASVAGAGGGVGLLLWRPGGGALAGAAKRMRAAAAIWRAWRCRNKECTNLMYREYTQFMYKS